MREEKLDKSAAVRKLLWIGLTLHRPSRETSISYVRWYALTRRPAAPLLALDVYATPQPDARQPIERHQD